MIRFQSLATKTFSSRLDVNIMFNQIRWINFDEYEKNDTGQKQAI